MWINAWSGKLSGHSISGPRWRHDGRWRRCPLPRLPDNLFPTMQQSETNVPLFPASPEHVEAGRALAERFALPWRARRPTAGPALRLGNDGVALLDGANRFRPLQVDFVRGETAFRHRHGGGVERALARAAGLRRGQRPDILDATAGLGRDGFVLAALGCRVRLVERSGTIACLLADGLRRAGDEPGPASTAARITLEHADAVAVMRAATEGAPADVVYLDPMYPQRRKSALPGREMQLLREIIGSAEDGGSLLAAALSHARHRVVVKRPRPGAALTGRAPDFAIATRHTRYDVYLTRAGTGARHAGT